jgi:hypothetical protein
MSPYVSRAPEPSYPLEIPSPEIKTTTSKRARGRKITTKITKTFRSQGASLPGKDRIGRNNPVKIDAHVIEIDHKIDTIMEFCLVNRRGAIYASYGVGVTSITSQPQAEKTSRHINATTKIISASRMSRRRMWIA